MRGDSILKLAVSPDGFGVRKHEFAVTDSSSCVPGCVPKLAQSQIEVFICWETIPVVRYTVYLTADQSPATMILND